MSWFVDAEARLAALYNALMLISSARATLRFKWIVPQTEPRECAEARTGTMGGIRGLPLVHPLPDQSERLPVDVQMLAGQSTEA